MHDDRALVERRIERVLWERLRPARYRASVPLDVAAWRVPGEPVPVAAALAAAYTPFAVGSRWGAPWSTWWFRVSGRVPAEWAGRPVEVVVDLGFDGGMPGFQAEGLAYDRDGVPLKGIAPDNAYVPVAAPPGGGPVELLLEAAANPTVWHPHVEDGVDLGDFRPTALGDVLTAGAEPAYVLRRVDLALRDPGVCALVTDTEVLVQLMRALAVGDPRRHEILRGLERMVDGLDLSDPAAVAAGAGPARDRLADLLARPAHASAHRVTAVGHAHIDSAWLWPVREARRKCARTFANATALGEQYPEFVFACSQAQQYAWVKQDQPAVFERIRAAVAAGRWAPVGGMWVESDANLPGGEALARQFVHGQRFFRDEFGVAPQEVWLPDSFGYSAALPQIARLAGARWFLTQKLSWNQTNAMPHHTFWWEGLDGTRIFTHFPPVDTYNARVTGAELAHAVANYADKGGGTRSLLPFGHGDGGGGPTREMVERTRRLADLEGSPRVHIGTPAQFFAAAQEEYPDAPVWSGELYLELHRGTYTTQSATKRGNRRSEHLLREAELWVATAAVRTGADYPYDRLDAVWKQVLLHQFHDILPGSAIGWVHREAAEAHAAVAGELEAMVGTVLRPDGDGPTTVLNASPYPRAEVVTAPVGSPAAVDAGGQALRDGSRAFWAQAAALGVGAPVPSPAPPVGVRRDGDDVVLDNGVVRVRVDARGLLTGILDLRAGRELVAPGAAANLLQLHDDVPAMWDAWDVDPSYRNTVRDLTDVDALDVVEHGPLVASVAATRAFGSSRITQTVTVTAGSARVDLVTDVDWQETEKLLKATFPFDVHADRSTAEVQFGHVHRPTHANTSWDAARFEIWAHRWVHVGDAGYGIGVVNEATYGHDVHRATRPTGGSTTTVRLSLVRAPRFPDPTTDRGRHRFAYGVVAGADVPETVRHGYAVNLPLRVGTAPAGPPLVAVDTPGVAVEAVKLADDRSGDVVVRLYEAAGAAVTAQVTAGFPVAGVRVVDLLEEDLAAPELRPGFEATPTGARLTLRPFQVVTLRFARAG